MELANLIVSSVLSVALVVVTIILAVKQNSLSKKIHQDQLKSNLYNERKNIYINLYYTFLVIENKVNQYSFLLTSENSQKNFNKLIEHKNQMLKDSALATFLFTNNAPLLAMLTKFYTLFDEYFESYFDFFRNLNQNIADFEKKENCVFIELMTSPDKQEKFSEYLRTTQAHLYEKTQEIISILNSEELKSLFNKYLILQEEK